MSIKHTFMAILLLCLFILAFPVKAKTTYLVVPAQYWTEASTNYSEWQPTQVIPFEDVGRYSGEYLCTFASRSIHKSDPAPLYSFCTTTRPNRRWAH